MNEAISSIQSGNTSLKTIPETAGDVIEWLSRKLVLIGAGLVLLMALLICFDVTWRFFFNTAIPGLLEIETFLLTAVVFLGLPFTTVQDAHVSVDLLTGKFSPKFSNQLKYMFSVLSLVLCMIISWQYVLQAIEGKHLGEESLFLHIPLYPFYLLLVAGFALSAVAYLAKVLWDINVFAEMKVNVWKQVIFLSTICVVILCLPGITSLVSFSMTPAVTGGFFISIMVILLFLGYPVAFTMALIGFLGTWYLNDLELSLNIIRISAYHSVSNYFFIVIPFFVFMGFIALEAGLTEKLYHAGYIWFGQLPGGLAIGTIFGCGGFAAICGDSMATAATMGSVSLPEMKKYGYDDSLATGVVAAGGTLGILIPPSLGLIIYAIITEQSVAKLFAAGMIPGIMLVLLFSLAVYIMCRIKPDLGPKSNPTTWKEKLKSINGLVPVFGLFGVVIGGIYFGIFTPTEGGGVGVIGALVLYLFSGRFTWKGIVEVSLTSLKMSVMIFMILIGVELLGYFITLTNIPNNLAELIGSLTFSRYVIFALILLLYLFLGMLMNIVPMIMLTLPIIFPTVIALGFNPIWFGVIMVIMMEMGQITPPMGINVFVISGVADNVPMAKIFKGVMPFVLVEIIAIVILTIFPDLVMFLPDSMDVLPSIG